MKFIFTLVLAVLIGSSCDKESDVKDVNQINFGTMHKDAPQETEQFGRLVGEWDVTSSDQLADGSWMESKAKWTFKYTLDGFAIEDIWYENVEDSTNNTITLGRDFTGNNYRMYDPVQEKWFCVWLDNRNNTMSGIWEASAAANGDVTMNDGTGQWQILFYNIGAASFDWKFESLQVDSTWVASSKMKARRLK